MIIDLITKETTPIGPEMGFLSRLFGNGEKELPFDLSLLQVDMHSHLIPGIDDGSRAMDETIALLAKFEQLGYKKIITTPHILHEVYPNTEETIENILQEVLAQKQQAGLTIELAAAAEYYFDETVLSKAREKKLLCIGKEYVLVEFSFHTAPDAFEFSFFEMQTLGYKPILAHFERYPYFFGNMDKAVELRDKGINIQLNLNSLTGHYGFEVKKQAERLIDSGNVDFVGTDCHRMQHLLLLEENLKKSYFHKLGSLKLKNNSLL